MPAGRPTDYSESMYQKTREYIDSCEDETKLIGDGISSKMITKVKLPSIDGLALHLGVRRSTIYEWQKHNSEFSDIIETLLQKQASVLLNNGLSGAYNPTIAKVILTKHGYTDKQEIDQKTEHSGTIAHNIDYTKLSDQALREIEKAAEKDENSDRS